MFDLKDQYEIKMFCCGFREVRFKYLALSFAAFAAENEAGDVLMLVLSLSLAVQSCEVPQLQGCR